MAHLVGGEHVADRLQHRRAVAVVHDLACRQWTDAAGGQIGRGIDREHPRHRARGGRVDAADDPMRVMAAHHHRIGLARQAHVVGIMPLAAQQHRVFRARHRLADREPVVGPQDARIDIVVHSSPLCLRGRGGFVLNVSIAPAAAAADPDRAACRMRSAMPRSPRNFPSARPDRQACAGRTAPRRARRSANSPSAG